MNKLNELKFLDGIRGLAAIYVLIHHARLILMEPYYEGFLKHKEQYDPFNKLMVYALSGFKFGHEAVLVFFVLSGFVIHLKQAQNNTFFSEKIYFQKRIIRIYPTVLTAMVLTFILAGIYSIITHSRLEGYGVLNFLGNISLIPSTPIWGNNFPVWSLKHEWMFYLIYPILLLLTRHSYLLSLVVPAFTFTLFCFDIRIPLLGEATYTILLWWLGAFLAEVYVQKIKIDLKKLRYLVIPALLLLLSPINQIPHFHHLFFCFFVIGVLSDLLTRQNELLLKFSFLGDFSYSLYLLHFPTQEFIKKIYLLYHDSLPTNIYLALIGSIISLIVVYPIFLLTEKKVQYFKNQKFHLQKSGK